MIHSNKSKSLHFPCLLLVVFQLLLYSSLYSQSKDPKSALEGYFKNIKNRKYKEAYAMLCEKEKKAASYEFFEKRMKQNYENPFVEKDIKELSPTLYTFVTERMLRYNIVSVKKKSDKEHTVNVMLIVPNVMAMIDEIDKATNKQLNDDKLSKEKRDKIIAEAIKKLYPKDNYPKTEVSQEYAVLLEKGSLKIFANWETEANQYKAEELRSTFAAHKEKGELKKAVETCRKILELDPKHSQAHDWMKELQAVIDESNKVLKIKPDPQVKSNVKVSNITVNDQFGMIKFNIDNIGKKKIKKVSCRILFLSKSGIVLKSSEFTHSFDEGYPLEPGDSAEQIDKLFAPPVSYKYETYKLEIMGFE